jgi:hypothetical protein
VTAAARSSSPSGSRFAHWTLPNSWWASALGGSDFTACRASPRASSGFVTTSSLARCASALLPSEYCNAATLDLAGAQDGGVTLSFSSKAKGFAIALEAHVVVSQGRLGAGSSPTSVRFLKWGSGSVARVDA